MSQPHAAASEGVLPPVPAGMTRREYKKYIASLGHDSPAPSAPEPAVAPISHYTADVADVARNAAAKAREAHAADVAADMAAATTPHVVTRAASAPVSPAAPMRRRDRRRAAASMAPAASAPTTPADSFRVQPVAHAAPPVPGAAQNAEMAAPQCRGVAERTLRAVPTPAAAPATGASAPSAPATEAVPVPTLSDTAEQYFEKSEAWYGNSPTTDSNVVPLRRPRNRSRGRKQSIISSVLASQNVLPKVGMVGVLGAAAIIGPFVASQAGGEKASDQMVRIASGDEITSDHGVDAASDATEETTDETVRLRAGAAVQAAPVGLLAEGEAASLAELEAARAEAEAASRNFNRSPLPGCEGKPTAFADAQNGRLPQNELCGLWQNGHSLRADAAIAFAKLNVEYQKRFGEPIKLTDSYRTYAQQVSLKRRKPSLAARPGTSEHGWGLAVDLGGGVSKGGERYKWMRENAPRFGWDNPQWARRGGSGPYEPWHWEYFPGTNG